jgi:hypothetical protein
MFRTVAVALAAMVAFELLFQRRVSTCRVGYAVSLDEAPAHTLRLADLCDRPVLARSFFALGVSFLEDELATPT